MQYIPQSRIGLVGQEKSYVLEALESQAMAGDGPFTRRAQAFLESHLRCPKVLLTHSCTAALEMAAILAEIGPGDEVIMPSFTFVSTANAFVLRGGVPVFIDVRLENLNLDETRIEQAITPRTKAIVPVHYAGNACEMNSILRIAEKHNLLVIEDAAQAIGAKYNDRPLGTIGHLGALSFHQTKNLGCGEGGALLINNENLIKRAEIIREKGTDRSLFLRGEVDKYCWRDFGSSYLPSDIVAAMLLAQLEKMESITESRRAIWNRYHEAFESLEKAGRMTRPSVPEYVYHNAHIYYLLCQSESDSKGLIAHLRENQIQALFHYVPLHDAPAGKKFGRVSGQLEVTADLSQRLVRLPLWPGMENEIDRIIDCVARYAYGKN